LPSLLLSVIPKARRGRSAAATPSPPRPPAMLRLIVPGRARATGHRSMERVRGRSLESTSDLGLLRGREGFEVGQFKDSPVGVVSPHRNYSCITIPAGRALPSVQDAGGAGG